jgi:hypothetical protein
MTNRFWKAITEAWKGIREGFVCGIDPRVTFAWSLYALGHLCGWLGQFSQSLLRRSRAAQAGTKCGPWRNEE